MAVVRKRQTLNSRDSDVLVFNFEDKLPGTKRITGNPAITPVVVEGDRTKNLAVSEIAIDETGKKVSCRVTAPVGVAYIIWEVTASIASGNDAFSTEAKVVGA